MRLDIAVQQLNHVYLQCLGRRLVRRLGRGSGDVALQRWLVQSPRMLTLWQARVPSTSSKYLGLSYAAMPLR